ncbi:MAG: UvrB/UvrC motif-containing protein [Christensenellales bacterium]
MKCEKCNKNEATFHSITNINGKVSEKHLCNECAKNEKDFSNLDKEFLDFNKKTSSFFDDMMSDFKTTLSYFTNPAFDSFLDYDDFFARPLFLENNRETENQKDRDGHKEIFKSKKSDVEKKLSEKEKIQLEIAKLDIALKKAVVEERYEDAVKLRDKIKELKNSAESSSSKK